MKKVFLIGPLALVMALAVLFAACGADTDDGSVLHWTFTEPIVDVDGNPWTAFPDSNEVMKTNAVLKNGLRLKAGVSADTQIYWFPDDPELYDGFSAGSIRVSGIARAPEGFIKIGRIQGPFEITLNYTAAGGSANTRPFIRFNDAAVPQQNGEESASIYDPRTLTFAYDRPFPVTITVGSNGSIKLFDVIITLKTKY